MNGRAKVAVRQDESDRRGLARALAESNGRSRLFDWFCR